MINIKLHKVNQDLRHLLDLEGNKKTCLDNLLEKHYPSKIDHNFLKPCVVRAGIMYGMSKLQKGKGASKRSTTISTNIVCYRNLYL